MVPLGRESPRHTNSNGPTFKGRKCLQFCVDIFHTFGFWPNDEAEAHDKWYYLRLCYPAVTIVRMLYSMVFHLINLFGVLGDIQHMAQYFIVGSLHAHVLVRIATFYFYRDDIKVLLDTIERMHLPAMLHDQPMRTAIAQVERRTAKFTKYLITAFVIGCTITLVFITILSWSTRTLPYRRFLPYDYSYTPVFEMTLICIHVLQLVDLSIVATFELSCIALLMLLIKQFQLLQYKLQNLSHHVNVKISKRRVEALSRVRQGVAVARLFQLDTHNGNDIIPLAEQEEDDVKEREKREEVEQRQLEPWNVGEIDVEVPAEEVVEGERRTPNCGGETATEGTWEPCSITDDQQNEEVREHPVVEEQEKKNKGDFMNKAEVWAIEYGPRTVLPETQAEMDMYLRYCVRHHEVLLWLVKEICRVFKFAIALLVVTSALGGIGFIYISTLASQMDAIVYSIALLLFCLYVLFLMYCWHGNLISEEAMGVRDAAYDCDWFGASSGFKATLRVIIARCERPLLIKGAGLTLSMKNFRLIMRSAYYGHTLLKRLFHGVKIDLGKKPN